MNFAHPEYIIGSIALAAVLLILWRMRWVKGLSLSEVVLRLSALMVLACALASPTWSKPGKGLRIPLLLDISESMESEVSQSLLEQAQKIASTLDAELEIFPFAKKTAAVATSSSSVRGVSSSWGSLDVGGTNIENALTTVLGSGEGNARPVLMISDGWESEGNSREFVSESSNPLHVYPLVPAAAQQKLRSFRIADLQAPLVAASEKSVEIRTSIRNASNEVQKGMLEILHAGRSISKKEISVTAGEELLVTTESDPSQEGIQEITARLTPTESVFTPSSQTIFISSEARERVLLISGAAEDERFLSEVLQQRSFQLTAQGVSAQINLAELDKTQAVILNNVAFKQLPEQAAERLSQYVQSGGGLIMIGGNRSFGLGGYRGTAIEDILPVELLPPQTEQKRLNVAVQLVLDKSRSMASGEKLEYAKEAAKEVVRNLKDEDYIGVIGFDADAWILVKLSKLADSREQAIERIGRLFPAKETNLFPALDEARRGLLRVNAGRKHIIVLTDGRVPDSGPYYIEYTKQMRLMGITVSTVLLGGDIGDSMLQQMADVGGGAFYQTLDARNLPKIFLSDVKVASGERTMKEDQEFQVRQGTGKIESTSLRNFPVLKGYVQTKAKSAANLELISYGSTRADPLLVSWKVGQGRSIAFTSDSSGRWTSAWVNWERYGKFFSELIDAARGDGGKEQDRIQFELRHFFDRGSLHIDLSIFSENTQGIVAGTLLLPNGSTREISLRELARGKYVSEVQDITAGKYEFRGRVGSRALTPVAFYLSGELFGEKKDQGYNTPLLSSLASVTHGALNPVADQLRSGLQQRNEEINLANWFLLAALLLLLIEIIRREIFRKGFRLFRFHSVKTL